MLDVYPAVPSDDVQHTVAGLVGRIYGKRHEAVTTLLRSDARAMFVCLWMLEPIYARRPRFCLDYMERRTHVREEVCENVYTTFAHHIFHGIMREAYQDMLFALYANETAPCFWPRLLVQLLIPRMRQQYASILRKAYLQIPLSKQTVHIIQGHASPVPSGPARNQASVDWLDSVLLFHNADPDKSCKMISTIGSAAGQTAWDATLEYLKPRLRQTDNAYAVSWRA